jgi:hypothetical protein
MRMNKKNKIRKDSRADVHRAGLLYGTVQVAAPWHMRKLPPPVQLGSP